MDLELLRDRLTCCGLSEEKYKDAVLSLLLAIADGTGLAPEATTPHTLATGTTSPVPAGAYSVTIQVSAGPSVINGITVPTNGSLTLTANNNKALPAIPITGGTFSWGAII